MFITTKGTMNMDGWYKLRGLLLGILILLFCSVSAQASELELTENHLLDPIYSVTKHSDGTYDIIAAVSVDGFGDDLDLKLKAVCGNMIQEQRNIVPGQYTFVFSGMTDCLSVNLVLCGNADTSQAEVSHYEKINMTGDLILNVHDDGPDDGRPSVYDLYKVSDQSTVVDDFDMETLQRYKARDNLIATIMTDDSGRSAYNFTQNMQSEGTYLIAEQLSQKEKIQKGMFFTIPYQTDDSQTNHHILNITESDFRTVDYDVPAAEYIVLPDTGGFGVKEIKGIGLLIIFIASALMLSNRRKEV